jgi:cyclophilin family peptidyl-prolyl cis-trans isomerase
MYVGDILQDQNCRIVLCSMQYVENVHQTLDYFINYGFTLHIQWLNPGHRDHGQIADDLNLVDTILNTRRSSFSIRDGRRAAEGRVQELREFIYGWALYRDLIRTSH